jgi:hypothetical protein
MSLRDILGPIDELLRRDAIPYAVVGGYAVAAWGEARATRDVDLLCSPQDLDRIKRLLASAKLKFEHRRGDPDDPISDVIRVEAGTPEIPYEVDILAGIRGAPGGILERARSIAVGDLLISVASPEDVIVLKLLGGSARDLEDVRGILGAQSATLDLSLVRRLCPPSLVRLLESLAPGIDGDAPPDKG